MGIIIAKIMLSDPLHVRLFLSCTAIYNILAEWATPIPNNTRGPPIILFILAVAVGHFLSYSHSMACVNDPLL